MSAAALTTLVIDDEPMVRHLVRRILEPEVCAVVEAENGEAGLRLIERQRGSIAVVLTDLVMPGIDGFDVAHVLAEHLPDLPVVCMSGYVSRLDGARELAAPLLAKPFTPEALLAAIAPQIERSRVQGAGGNGFPGGAVDLVARARALRSRRAEPPAPG